MASLGLLEESRIHALVFAYPSQGHIGPALELSYLLLAHGARVTFVSTKTVVSSVSLDPRRLLQVVGLADLPPSVLSESLGFMRRTRVLQPGFEEVVKGAEGRVVLVSDTFCPWVADVAEKFKLPWTALWTCSATSMLVLLRLDILIENGYVPSKGGRLRELTETVDFFPELPELHISDMPASITNRDIPSWVVDFLLEQMKYVTTKAHALLVHTFQELEADLLPKILHLLPPLYPIGPLLPPVCFPNDNANRGIARCKEGLEEQLPRAYLPKPKVEVEDLPCANFSMSKVGVASEGEVREEEPSRVNVSKPGVDVASSTVSEEEGCMHWLSKQAVGSVVYVAFGSLAIIGVEQLRVLAQGIEASGQAFLWVIRNYSSLSTPLESILPHGFLDRCIHPNKPAAHVDLVAIRGMIVSWAPQVQVLQHPAVGGFLSHCGWNSILEAVCAGVPLIAWPQFAEQAFNAKLIEDEWNIGIRLQLCPKDNKSLTGSATIVDCIHRLFHDDGEGASLRLNVKSLSHLAHNATMKGGSSHSHILAFLGSLTST